MTRPDWHELVKQTSGAYLSCSCGQILQTMNQVRMHWQFGHFDIPDTPDTIEENKRLRAALKQVEWIQVFGDPFCPWCSAIFVDGHADDCVRQAALERKE
jgi:hypothetical protein